jgi:hypothetical protein
MPAKRPEYRRDRPHTDFLVNVKDHSPLTSLDHFSDNIKLSLEGLYEVTEVSQTTVDEIVAKIEVDTNKSADELARSKMETI